MADVANGREVSAPAEAELRQAYAGKRVLVTGHTGFKGSWLALWLAQLDAEVAGYALAPDDPAGLFVRGGVEARCRHTLGDVRNLAALRATIEDHRPDYVFHLAAQPLVRRSYQVPLETLETNVMGTANLLEAVRLARQRCAVVVVTSDKCYDNRESPDGYGEDDPLGGSDVYSMSKGATELVVASYRKSFFPPARTGEHGVRLASARAGNVIGGGDFALDRIVPDAVRALRAGESVPVRNPDSVRPWQHVLDPLGGYLLLGARLAGIGTTTPADLCEAWNFGPALETSRSVGELMDGVLRHWGTGAWAKHVELSPPPETRLLRLRIDKARERLGWAPRWGFEESVRRTVEWYRLQAQGASPAELGSLCRLQIGEYLRTTAPGWPRPPSTSEGKVSAVAEPRP